MQKLREQIAKAAPTNGRVLIYGENGTGKELVARSVHAMSLRSEGPFGEVNCAAIPEELIESELFGYRRGAFTGAVTDREGKFEAADGGTLFLDEVGDMSLKTQAKVLRVLQEQVVERVGGEGGVRVDVRIIAATNKDLRLAIESGTFRDDLFFRLNVIPVFVSPLRDRRKDIPLLAEHFLGEFAQEYGHRVKSLDDAALTVLKAHSWPGNVRELRNVLERLAIMVPGETITATDLEFLAGGGRVAGHGASVDAMPLQQARDQFERDYIVRALVAHHGNISRTAGGAWGRAQQPLSKDEDLWHHVSPPGRFGSRCVSWASLISNTWFAVKRLRRKVCAAVVTRAAAGTRPTTSLSTTATPCRAASRSTRAKTR